MDAGYKENDEFCNYRSALSTRYASKEMKYNFSDMKKFSTWRKLWVFLASGEKVKNKFIIYPINSLLFIKLNNKNLMKISAGIISLIVRN